MSDALTPGEVLARYAPHAETVPSFLHARVSRVPQASALRYGTREYTYTELAAASDALARALAASGVSQGSRVAVVAPNSDLTVLVFLATAKLGAVFAPMNINLTDTELAYLLGHTKPGVVFTEAAAASRVRQRLNTLDLPATVMVFDEIVASTCDVDGVVSALTRRAGTNPLPEREPDPGAPLVIVYTSGTTGFPKGVVHTHRNYVFAAEAFVERMYLQPHERLLTVLPFFHINALFYSLGGALAAGACVIVSDGFSASRFWEMAVETGATEFNIIAAVGGILAKRPREEFRADHRITKVYGGPITPDVEALFRRDFGIPNLIEGYGMSEIPGACNNPYRGRQIVGSFGLPAQHPRIGTFVQTRVVDDDGQEVGVNMPGELEVKTPIVFKEYLHDPQQTNDAFHDGWFKTGDLVRLDADGYHYFIARKKDIIRVRGENIAGAELDRVLGLHPAVQEAATIGVPADVGEEEILAVLIARDAEVPFQEIAEWARGQLAAIKIPRYWVWTDSLPHTPSHRVAKHLLKRQPELRARAFDLKTLTPPSPARGRG